MNCMVQTKLVHVECVVFPYRLLVHVLHGTYCRPLAPPGGAVAPPGGAVLAV